jgi:hypothetical protein
MAHEQCRPITFDENISYDASPTPWSLDPESHPRTPIVIGQSNFCVCLWSHIPTGLFVVDPQTFELVTVWTPQADHTLAILWFHSRLHTEHHATWTGNHYHEALSVILGYRVSQHDLFARLKHMRNTLAQCWVEACMAASSSTVVTEVFTELNAKWGSFMSSFDHWDEYLGLVVEDGEDDSVQLRCLEPFAQWNKIVEMSGDMDRFLSKSEEQPEYFDKWLKWWIGR